MDIIYVKPGAGITYISLEFQVHFVLCNPQETDVVVFCLAYIKFCGVGVLDGGIDLFAHVESFYRAPFLKQTQREYMTGQLFYHVSKFVVPGHVVQYQFFSEERQGKQEKLQRHLFCIVEAHGAVC